MRKGATGQIPGVDIFYSIEFSQVDSMGGIILCIVKDPIGPAVGWRLKPLQGPEQVSPCWDILFSMLSGTPHHAEQMPRVMKTGIFQSERLPYLLNYLSQPKPFSFQHGVTYGATRLLDESQTNR